MAVKKRDSIVRFAAGGSELDNWGIALLRDRDTEGWKKFVAKYPQFLGKERSSGFQLTSLLERAYDDLGRKMEAALAIDEREWRKVENKWFSFLGSIMDPGELLRGQVYKANTGIGPICPRVIEKRMFLVTWDLPPADFVGVCAHELSHFYFYSMLKMRRLRDKILSLNAKEIWRLSEILVPLLFSDRRSIEILGEKPLATYVCRRSTIIRLLPLYKRMEKGLLSIEEFFRIFLSVRLASNEIASKAF